MSRKEKYLHDLCEARKRIQELEEENVRLRVTIHRLVALKNELLNDKNELLNDLESETTAAAM